MPCARGAARCGQDVFGHRGLRGRSDAQRHEQRKHAVDLVALTGHREWIGQAAPGARGRRHSADRAAGACQPGAEDRARRFLATHDQRNVEALAAQRPA